MIRPKLLVSVLVAAVLSAGAQNRTITEKDIPSVLKELTTEQKARLLVGTHGTDKLPSHRTPGAAGWTYAIPELGIPSINLADGPVGPRINPKPWNETTDSYDSDGNPRSDGYAGKTATADPEEGSWCTAFPSTTALAATFDREAARSQGEIMGNEARAYGIDVLLTPGVNIMRNPLCGRNFEYYSEDPLLAGTLAAELIKGIQSRGVGTSLKHFVANNQQTGKQFNDARISQRALREIYLPAFEMCVREAKPWTLMSSYNLIGGEYTQTNTQLLQDLLRKEWGFDGAVVTDWSVWRPADKLIKARTALIMPGREKIVDEIIAAVNKGAVTEAQLDSCVADVLRLVSRSLTAEGWTKSRPDLEANAAESRRIGAEGMVLLKNNDRTLPLRKGARIAVFGTGAYQSIGGGTGSSNVNKKYIVDIDHGLENAGFKVSKDVQKLYRDYNDTQARLTEEFPGCPDWQLISYHRPVISEMNLAKASKFITSQAKDNDAAVIVLSRKSGETADRVVDNDYNLSDIEKNMITQVCGIFHAEGKPVVLVMNVCGAMEIASWRDMPDAILAAWYPGQECGNAVADVLSGKVNPSGRLPFTMPVNYTDLPSSRNYPYLGQKSGKNFEYTNYEEDIWVGYRFFEKDGSDVAYPFGYGLSYTDFEYTQPKVSRKGNITTVSVTVTNAGDVAGREVVQLYVSAPEGKLVKPVAELRGFAKTRELAPGESQRVSITVPDSRLASFDQDNSQWVTDKGTYQARLGRSAGDYIVSLPFTVKKELVRKVENLLAPVEPVKAIKPASSPYHNMTWHEGTDFRMLGKVYPDSLPIYSRVPAFMHSYTRSDLVWLGGFSAGIAIRFRSDSPKLALDWENTQKMTMSHMADIGTRGADLYWLNENGEWRSLAPARPMGENPSKWMMIENMEPVMREYLLHLPLYDGLNYVKIGIEDGYTIDNPVVDSPKAALKPVVIYGTSIAHGATASRPGMAPSNYIRRALDRDVINLGFSGNAHLDYEIANMMADVDAAVYVMDNIPNSWVNEINEKTEKFVKILRDRHPDVPIIFIEDPHFTTSQLDKRMLHEVESKNEALRAVYRKMVDKGLKNTYYITSDQIVTEDGEWSSDGIHYTDHGFVKYCDTLIPVLRKAIKD